MRAIPLRRGLSLTAAAVLATVGLVALPATANALPLQCTGSETPGNDTILCPFLLPGQTVNSGAGSDNVTVLANATGTITTGPGDDDVTIGAGALGELSTGDGADTVTFTGDVSTGSVNTGAGPDITIVIITLALTFNVHVQLGAGDDTANLPTVGNSTGSVNGGADNDTITVLDCLNSDLHGDSGNDTIDVTAGELCDLFGDSGNDNLNEGPAVSGVVDGGSGTDMCTQAVPILSTEQRCET